MQLSHVSNSKQTSLPYQSHFDGPNQKSESLRDVHFWIGKKSQNSNTSAWSDAPRTGHTQGSGQMLDIIPCKLRHRFMPPLRPAMPRVKISTRHHYVEMLNMPKLDSLSLQIVFYTAGKTSVTQAGSLVWVDRPIICTITSVLTHQLSWQYVISQFKSSLKAYTDTQK